MRSTALWLAGIVVAGLAACDPPTMGERQAEQTAKIVGGTTSQIEKWPGMTYLEIQGQHSCGAALVGAEWVMTASHCVDDPRIRPDHVVIGRQSLTSTDGERIAVAKIIIHPNYNPETTDNDVALIQLTQPSKRKISRIVTQAEWDAIEVGAPFTVVGWGNTTEDGTSSNDLREVTVPVVPRAECAESYAEDGVDVSPNMFCAGEAQGGKDACQGDSGGPIFAKVGDVPVQVGIVSWGIGCARPGKPGVYTRVANFLGWLTTESNGGVGKSGEVVPGSEDAGLADAGAVDPPADAGVVKAEQAPEEESADEDEDEDEPQPKTRKRRPVIQTTTTTCQMLPGRPHGGTSTAVTMLALGFMLSLRGKRRRLER